MNIGTLLLISLLQCFSFQVEVKIKFLPGFNPKEGISPAWTQTDQKCIRSGWIVGFGRASLTCTIDGLNCTLQSPEYDVTEANELFVNIVTETRKCNTLIKGKFCEETFALLAVHRDKKNLNKPFTKFLGTIPASPSRSPNESSSMFFKANDVINFSRDQKYSHVKLALQESSYCGTVTNVTIFYYKCSAKGSELVVFQNVVAPNKSASPILLTGKCTKDSVIESYPLRMRCHYNGTFEVFGSCKCKAGFTNVHNKCQGQYFSQVSSFEQHCK